MTPSSTILVTGATGFLGRHLVEQLREQGADSVLATSRRSLEGNQLCLDLGDYGDVRACIERYAPDVIFNLAGSLPGSGSTDVAMLMRDNFNTVFHLLEALRETSCDATLVLVGSAAEYGLPQSSRALHERDVCMPIGSYAYSKWLATRTALDFRERFEVDVRIARVFNLLGPGVSGKNVVGAVIRRYFESDPRSERVSLEVGDLSARRDFVDVRDAVAALFALAGDGVRESLINIASGNPVEVSIVIEKLLSHADRPVELKLRDAHNRDQNPPVIFGDNERLIKSLGFEFRFDLDTTLRDTWAYAASGHV
jgi:GDP-4-dehydro-6-deoxy-D-mannose reductase